MLGYLLRISRNARDLIDYIRAFRRDEHTHFKVTKASKDKYITTARKLHADVYLDRGFIEKNDVIGGFIGHHLDPYHFHSQYFVLEDTNTSEIIATARQIMAKPDLGHESFAMVRHSKLYDRVKRQIDAHAPLECTEISGLAKKRGASKLAPLLLYRAMWHHSLLNNHKIWLLAVDVRLYHRLKLLFGPALQKAGHVKFYLGSDVVPAVLKLSSSVRSLERSLKSPKIIQRIVRRKVVGFMLNGIPEDALSASERKALHRIRHEKTN